MGAQSFKRTVLFSCLLVTIVSFGALLIALDRFFAQRAAQDLAASLSRQAFLIQAQIDPQRFNRSQRPHWAALSRRLGEASGARVTFVDTEGEVLGDSQQAELATGAMENHRGRPEIAAALAGKTGTHVHLSSVTREEMFYLAVPVLTNEQVAGAIRLAVPFNHIRTLRSNIRRITLGSAAFALVLAFLLSSFLSAFIIRPLSRIVLASRRFAHGDFSRRIYIDSPRELFELAETLNAMSVQLQERISQVTVQHQHLEAVFNSMVEGVVVVDCAGRILSLNHATEAIFGVTRAQAGQRPFLEVIRNAALAEIVSGVIDDKAVRSQELVLEWPLKRVFRVTAVPVFEGEAIRGGLLMIHDITEFRRLETVRRDFVANVSHELKTPLTAIKGFVETLRDGALEDAQHARHFLDIIQEHSQRLESLINDLLTLSYLESDAVSLDRAPVPVRPLVDAVIDGYAVLAQRQKVSVRNDIPGALIVRAERSKLQQVFANLIDNAIKFNRPDGSVVVSASPHGRFVRFTVCDTGAGIPARDLPRIFERFYRVDKGRSRQLGGTGLGLSIVKHIVELHGGSVGVESTEGAGSLFWFLLPA